jgi:hypothetical protein
VIGRPIYAYPGQYFLGGYFNGYQLVFLGYTYTDIINQCLSWGGTNQITTVTQLVVGNTLLVIPTGGLALADACNTIAYYSTTS